MDLLKRHGQHDRMGMEEAEVSAPAPAIKLDVVRSVKLHPKLAGGVALVVFVWMVAFALQLKPMYEAQSLSYVEPLVTKVVSDSAQGFYDPARYDSYIQQQIQTVQRQDILEAAIKKLPPGTWQMPGEDIHSAADRLGNALKIQRVGTSYQLAISMSGPNAENTAAVVNAATNAFLEQGRKDENTRSDARVQLLQDESQRIQTELQQDRTEQAELSRTLGVASSDSVGTNPYDVQLAGVRTELVEARQAHDVAAAQLATVSVAHGANPDGLKAVAEDAIAGDAGLAALKSSINMRRATLASQMAGLTPANPVYKQDQDELAEMDRQLEERTATLRVAEEHRLADKLRLELQRTGDVESRLNAQLAHATAQASSAAPKLQRAQELTADIQRLQMRYATVDDALRGLQLESNGPGTAHLLVAAEVPKYPAANRKAMLLALALPLALFAGIAAAVVAKKRDPRLYLRQDVETVVGVAPLGVMPVSYEVTDAVMGEFLLRLSAGLERCYRVNHARSFVFTAASLTTEIDGLVASLREKLSELGFKAVVLEADQMRQTPVEQKVTDRLDGIAATKLEKLKKANNFVLICARPLLQSADAEYAASSADTTMLVVESGVTTNVEVKQGLVLLRRLKASGVGTVLVNLHAEFGEPEFKSAIEVVERRPEWYTNEKSHEAEPGQHDVADMTPEVTLAPHDVLEPAAMALPAAVAVSPEVEVVRRDAGVPLSGVHAIAQELAKKVAVVEPVAAVVEPEGSAAPVAGVETPVVAVEMPVVDATAVSEPVAEPEIVAPMAEVAAPVENNVVAVPEVVQPVVDEAAERAKEIVIARVRARFAESGSIVKALAAEKAATTPSPADEPTTRMMMWGASIKSSKHEPVAAAAPKPEPVAVVPEPVAEKTLEAVEPEPVVATPLLVEAMTVAPEVVAAVKRFEERQPLAAWTPALPVRIVERRETGLPGAPAPVIPWAPRVERRRAERVAALPHGLGFPQGLNRAVRAISGEGSMKNHAASGPKLTAAEQAVALAATVGERRTLEAPVFSERRPAEITGTRRWGLLSRFDERFAGRAADEEQERAAG